MKIISAIVVSLLLLSCSKTSDLIEQWKPGENQGRSSVSEFMLQSFTAKKGSLIPMFGCKFASSLIEWSATGESYISQYELQSSNQSNFSSINGTTIIAAGLSDVLVNRSLQLGVGGGGNWITTYYRLKIFYRNGTTSFGTVATTTLKSPRCNFNGF